jgi:hypothetical protein
MRLRPLLLASPAELGTECPNCRRVVELSESSSSSGGGCSGGVGLGTIIALPLSWTTFHSVGLQILHGILGWLFVIYYILTRGLGY